MNKTLSELTNEELWELFPVMLSEPQTDWGDKYNTEERAIVGAIGKENIVRISHIGSTSVPGLLAKPTIDILLELEDFVEKEILKSKMEAIGYIFTPQPLKPTPYLMCMKGYTIHGFEGQAYHVHLRYAGDWDELYFRDYLVLHPEVAKEYGELKRKLKDQYEHDRDAYTAAKTDFIKEVTFLAREEFKNKFNN